MIVADAGSPATPARPGSAPSRASPRRRFRRMAVGLTATLLGGLMAGCTLGDPESSGPSTPSLPTDGACHELNEGRVQFETHDAQRVLFAVGPDREETEISLTSCLQTDAGYIEEWVTPAYVGAGGFGPPEATEVDSLQTPTGSYTMTEAFGREDPGTALDYHTLTPQSYWGGHPGSESYNDYFEGPGDWPDENLWKFMQSGLYEQAVVINFNRPPDAETQPDLSYAIFLHAGLVESWGCVSTDLETVTRVLQNATPGDRIVMGAEDDVFADPDTPDSASTD